MKHGTTAGYHKYQCRCPACHRASYLYEKRRRLRRLREGPLLIPNDTARQQLRELMALGWPGKELARRIGWVSNHVAPILDVNQHLITIDLARRVSRVYDELWEWPGPSPITAARARKAGWPLPAPRLDEDPVIDVVLIDRALEGERVALTPEEKAEALRVGVGRGMLPFTAAKLLRMNGEMVNRYLAGGQPKQRGPKKAA